MKRRRTTRTPSDSTAAPLPFLVLDAKGGVFYQSSVELYGFEFGTMACNNCKFICM
jgi:hypothetical protein